MKRAFTRFGHLVKWGAKCGAALLLSLAIWEVILRVAVFTPMPYQHYENLGWMPQPHIAGVFALEGFSLWRCNELGFRDDPVAPPETGQTRVLCLGDSFTQGLQMSVDETYPRLLQTLLREHGMPAVPARLRTAGLDKNLSGAQAPDAQMPGAQMPGAAPRARVFNAGRSGVTTAFSVGLAEEYKRIFQPDWTVVQVRDGWGQLFDSTQEVHLASEGENFRLVKKWTWETMSLRRKLLVRWHVRDIMLFQYGHRHLKELRRGGGEGDLEAEDDTPAPLSAGETMMECGRATGAREKRAIAWTVARLKAAYPKLILVHIPFGSARRNGLMPAAIEEKILVAECRRQGVPLIAMRPYFEEDARRSRQAPIGFANTLPWAGHPNARAHALIARALYDYLSPRLQQDTRRAAR